MSQWNNLQQNQNNFSNQTNNQQGFQKKSEEDEDTLSLDSERSQGFINEPVNAWPAWTIGNSTNAANTNADMFARYPVNSYSQPIFNNSFPNK